MSSACRRFGSARSSSRRVSIAASITSMAVLVAIVPAVSLAGAQSASAAAKPAVKVTTEPDEVSAMIAARSQNAPVEIVADRTTTSSTFANADGSLSLQASAGPIWVHANDGSWAKVDKSLSDSSDGRLHTGATTAALSLSDGGTGDLIRLSQDGKSVTVSWPGSLPVPTVDGNIATYANVAPNIDLQVIAGDTGYELSWVIKARPSTVPVFALPIHTSGLSVSSNSDSTLAFTNTSGDVVASGSPGAVFGADGAAAGDPLVAGAVAQGLATGSVSTVSASSSIPVAATPVSSATPSASPSPSSSPSVSTATSSSAAPSPSASISVGTAGPAVPGSLPSVSSLAAAFPGLSVVAPGTAMTSAVQLISPAESLLSGSVTYPVTVDPSTNFHDTADTYVDSATPSTTYDSADYLYTGKDGSAAKYRSFFTFPVPSTIVGTYIDSAYLQVYNSYSSTCSATAATINVSIPSTTWNSSTDWSNVPSAGTTVGSAQFVHNGPSCPGEAYQNITITPAAQDWANATYTAHQLEMYTEETDVYGYRQFYSDDIGSGAPAIYITYNHYPTLPTGLSPATGTYTASAPDLSAVVADQDGGSAYGRFYVKDVTGGTTTWVSSSSGSVGTTAASGGPSAYQVPGPLINGDHYQWQVKSEDYSGGVYMGSGLTAWQDFYADNTAPAIPTFSSSTFTSGGWVGKGATGSINWSDTSSDVTKYTYWIDGQQPITSSATSVSVLSNLPAGLHTLTVQALDRASNETTGTFTFGTGPGGIVTPAEAATTQLDVTLNTKAASGNNYVEYNYVRGVESSSSNPWSLVPVGDVKVPGGTGLSSWPYAASGGVYGQLTWNALSTLQTLLGKGNPVDGPLQIEACFATTSAGPFTNCSTPTDVTMATHTFSASAATTQLGPGTLSEVTGDFAVSATDASVFGMSVGRTFTTLSPSTNTSGATGIFGPGWVADIPGVDAGAGDETLADFASKGYATLTDSTGSVSTYDTSNTTYPYTFYGVGDADDGSVLTATRTGTSPAYAYSDTLTDTDGTVTTWTWDASTSQWEVASIAQPGGASTSYTYVNGQVVRILAPTPAGITCPAYPTPLVQGCQGLTLTYATSTTATAGTPGDFVGRLKSIQLNAWDPSTGAMASGAFIADYAYSTSGQLLQERDPRITPLLVTSYTYDPTSGRLLTITPPGQAAWTIDYYTGTDGTGADQAGMVADVKRTDPVNGVAEQVVEYGVGLSGSGQPDVTAATAASWDQTSDNALYGTAVFPASHAPSLFLASSTSWQPTSTEWPYASIDYIDANGRVVNSANNGGATGWNINSTGYDLAGNSVWSLSAQNRADALNATSGDGYVNDIATSAQRAALLSSTTTYSADESEVLSTLGPTHQVQLSTGVADAQAQTTNSYDASEPSGGPYRLLTQATMSPLVANGAAPGAADQRVTVTAYGGSDVYVNSSGAIQTDGTATGWTLRQPTSTTVRMGVGGASSSNDITSSTTYYDDGDTYATSQPASNGSDAGTTRTYYYVVGPETAAPECGSTGTGSNANAIEWAGLMCQQGPAAAPSSGGSSTLPTTVYTYDLYGHVLTETETSGSSTTRTTTNGYTDANSAGARLVSTSITTSGITTTAVPTRTLGYDSSTGLQTTVTDSTGTITTGYNAIGETTSYSAQGNTTSSGYDIDGNLTSRDDAHGATTYTVNATDSNGNAEHRGVVTAESVALLGGTATFKGSYNADGTLVSQTYPTGLVGSSTIDPDGAVTSQTYALTVAGSPPVTTPWMTFSITRDEFGQTVSQSSSESSQAFTYDNDGRLTQTQDSDGANGCTTRAYAFSASSSAQAADGNRTAYTEYPPASDGTCSTSTTPDSTSATYSYNTADQLTGTGISYDALGRTLGLPAGDVTGGAATAFTYYANDKSATITAGTGGSATAMSMALDPTDRFTQTTYTTGGTETRRTVNYFDGAGDAPAYITTSTNLGSTWTWQQYVDDLGGDMAIEANSTGTAELELSNPHGDLVATVPLDFASGAGIDCTNSANAADPSCVGPNSYSESTEFGLARGTDTQQSPYGWLGDKQRSNDAVAGIVLMGDRLYNPILGRFLSLDPEVGGNENAYNYPDDPINNNDISGRYTEREPGGEKNPTRIIGVWGRHPHLHGIVSFFSYRSWISSLAELGQRHFRRAIYDFLGESSNYTIPLAKLGERRLAKYLLFRVGSHLVDWPVGVLATLVDFYGSGLVFNPGCHRTGAGRFRVYRAPGC